MFSRLEHRIALVCDDSHFGPFYVGCDISEHNSQLELAETQQKIMAATKRFLMNGVRGHRSAVNLFSGLFRIAILECFGCSSTSGHWREDCAPEYWPMLKCN